MLLTLSVCRSAESEGDLDRGANPHIDDQIYDTTMAYKSLAPFERLYRLPRGTFTPVVGYTDEGVDRAESHVAELGARFTMIPDPDLPGSYLAYTTYVFQHPRLRRWKHAVMMLSITPGLNAELMGEAHFPDSLSLLQKSELWNRINKEAKWDRRQITSLFGRFALHF